MRMVFDECGAARCKKPTTHIVTMRVLATKHVAEFTSETGYCMEDALYFAAWLPYCYPGEYELVSITPPASELFGD